MSRTINRPTAFLGALTLIVIWTGVQTLPAADFNGDGFADLAVGAPNENVGSGNVDGGAVSTIYGTPGGLTTDDNQYWTQNLNLLGSSENNDNLGRTLAAGDFDGDGYIDLAIGVPDEDVTVDSDTFDAAGLVNIVYGSADGLTEAGTQYFYQSQPDMLTTSEEGDRFGAALAVGDFNGDTYDDLAVGVPTEDNGGIEDAGAVHVIFGSPTGLSPSWVQDDWLSQDEVEGDSQEGNHFGSALAAADFDGDGYDDLAIAAERDDLVDITDSGSVGIIWGSSSGLETRVSLDLWHQDRTGLPDLAEEYDFFGHSLTAGNFNGDAYADLAIGVPFEDTGTYEIDNGGAVHVLYGTATGITGIGSGYFTQDMPVEIGSYAEAGDQFGEVLAAGDLDGDGYDDLAIGSPHEDWDHEDTGIVQVLWGSADGIDAPDQLWREDLLDRDGMDAGDNAFGSALAVGDFTGDGIDDLAVSSPFSLVSSQSQAGTVFILPGTSTGLSSDNQTFSQGGGAMIGTTETGDRFGTALCALPGSEFSGIFRDGFESGDLSAWE